ncbi:hypothetical protein Vi05172_g5358 [Venturia inaequalis]|nr:hypothetical protein Vi05172_g5358 [Venturia inaequalis]
MMTESFTCSYTSDHPPLLAGESPSAPNIWQQLHYGERSDGNAFGPFGIIRLGLLLQPLSKAYWNRSVPVNVAALGLVDSLIDIWRRCRIEKNVGYGITAFVIPRSVYTSGNSDQNMSRNSRIDDEPVMYRTEAFPYDPIARTL